MASAGGFPLEYPGAIDAATVGRRGWRPPGLPDPSEQAWVERIYVEESEQRRLLRDAERAVHRAEAMARLKQAIEEQKRLEKAAEEEKQRSAATQAMMAAAAKARKAADDLQRRNAKGRIARAWLDHAVVDGAKGTGIHVEFHVSGMEGTSGLVAAFLKYRDGTGVRNKNHKYGTSDGFVATAVAFTPGFPNAHYRDLSLFIPDTECHLSVRRVELMWDIVLLTEPNGRELGRTRLECVWEEK